MDGGAIFSPVIALDDVTVFAMVADQRMNTPKRVDALAPKTLRSDANAAQVSVPHHSSSSSTRSHSGQKQARTIQLDALSELKVIMNDGQERGSLVLMEERDAETGAEMTKRTIEFTTDRPHRASQLKPALIHRLLTYYR